LKQLLTVKYKIHTHEEDIKRKENIAMDRRAKSPYNNQLFVLI